MYFLGILFIHQFDSSDVMVEENVSSKVTNNNHQTGLPVASAPPGPVTFT